MTPTRLITILFLTASALFAGTASAHGVRFGIGIGFPIFPAPWYYPPPYYYPPPPVVVAPSPPPVYVERNEQAAAPAEHYWYYCADSQAYYPYVKQCASPWQRHSPTPPGTR